MLRLREILDVMAMQQALGAPDRTACFGCVVSPEHTSYAGSDLPAEPTEASPPKPGERAIGYRIEIDTTTGEELYLSRGTNAGK